eukprot:gene9355-11016_t
MSESDSNNKNSSALKLNAKASEFVPGSYGSKPAAKTSAPVVNNQAPKGMYNNNRPQGQNNYNNRNIGRPNNNMMMPQQQQYYAPPFQMSPAQELHIYHMQVSAAQQGLMYDPASNAMYTFMNGVPVCVVPSTHMPPFPDFGVFMPPVDGEMTAENVTEEGEVLETSEAVAEVPIEESAAVEEPKTEETTVPAAAPAASTGKYVPPNRSSAPGLAPAATAAAPVPAVEQLAQKASTLSISTDDDTPVDIESPTGEALRYPKQAILALFSSDNVTIPAILRDFYKAEDFEADREAGELVEGDEGFVPYDESNPAPEQENRGRNKKKNQNNLPPAVYKSRFALDASDPQAIVRKANAILNKLSVTNFEKLSDEFLALLQSDATTEDAMHRGVEALVTKAQMEENFCFIYADLCRKIIDTWATLEPDDNTFSTAAKEDGEDGEAPTATEGEEAKAKELRTMGKIFKDSLLQRCQNEFEFDHIAALKVIRENADLQPDERTEKEILLKKRITGHMRFIGELYMKDLIKANVIKSFCLDVLIESVFEEELVCMCKLFQTIGARLEKYFYDKSRQKKNKSKNFQEIFPAYFERIAEIGNNHPSSRVRFMMKDLVDMRFNDWTARREEEKMVNLVKKAEPEAQFKPVVSTPYVSGDARNSGLSIAEAVVDEWSVVPGGGKKKPSAPSPVPPAALSRSGSSAQMSRTNSSSNGNLSGMDKRRPGPAGGPAANAPRPAGKPAGNNPRDGRPAGKDAKPRTGPNRGNSVSPVPSEAAEGADAESAAPAVVMFNSDLAEVTKKLRSAVKEYYRNGLVEEATLTFQEVNPLPTLVGDLVKDLLCQCVELSSEKDCAAFVTLLAALRTVFVAGSNAPVLNPEQVKEGVLKFLNVVDEMAIDVPKASSLGANILGNLVSKDLLSLELFANIPDENEFSFSSRFADTVLLAVKELAVQTSDENATLVYKAAGLDLLKNINAPPKQSPEEVLADLATKYGVAFILA